MQELFSRLSKKAIRSRVKKVAIKVRAVEEHEDLDYRIAILATLIDSPLIPHVALRDKIASALPRLDTTPIDEYFSKGTYVDEVRFDRIIGEMKKEGSLGVEIMDEDGVEIALITKKEKEEQ